LEDFKIGDVIRGKYEVTRVLSKGGMGIVLEAIHRELGVHVATKFPRPGVGDPLHVGLQPCPVDEDGH
jgi:serine/threonine protein kinase